MKQEAVSIFKPSKKLLELLKENDIEQDTIDWTSYSRDISMKDWLKNEYGIVLKDLKKLKGNAEAQEEKFKIEQLNKMKDEENKLINEWKKTDFHEIDIKSFIIPQHYIKMVCRNFSKGCVLIGEGGLGKSFMTTNTLIEEKKDFVYLNTHTSPLELYKFIYHNREAIIVFDDVKGLLDNEKSISILKACLWETDGKRIVTMNTMDRLMDNVPKVFEFKGGIIILANRLNETDEHLQALITRCNFYELKFSYKEKLKIMSEITKKPYKQTNETDRNKALDML